MPIKEIMALAATIMGAIFISHPLSFQATVHRLEFSMLRELTRTDNWGNPSIYPGNRYMRPRGKARLRDPHKAVQKDLGST